MASLPIKRDQFAILGRVLCKYHPEVAEKLLPICVMEGESDLQKIDHYYDIYKALIQDQPHLVEPKWRNRKITIERSLFIGAILLLYNKNVYVYAQYGLVNRIGISRKIGKVLGMGDTRMSFTIQQVLFDYQKVTEFRDAVNTVVDHIKKTENGQHQKG